MRWIVGILMLGLLGVQSAVIVWQRSMLSSATERRLQHDDNVRQLEQRIAELDRTLAESTAAQHVAARDSQHGADLWREERRQLSNKLDRAEQQLETTVAERNRATAALADSAKELAGQLAATGKLEQELSLVRAELLWLKVRGNADPEGLSVDGVRKNSAKQPGRAPETAPPPVVTARSSVAVRTVDAAPAVPISAASASDGEVSGGTRAQADAASAVPPKKALRREARRIRKDAPADEPVFSFLP